MTAPTDADRKKASYLAATVAACGLRVAAEDIARALAKARAEGYDAGFVAGQAALVKAGRQ